ncbi:MAG: hypothetical protein JXA91_07590 [Candidatus Thermoplasmatota archaeon]|nr:hypothetical protein [Candidatus Thermoplasmatota archaeon]
MTEKEPVDLSDIEKVVKIRKLSPFRYLDDKEEIEREIKSIEIPEFTVMKAPENIKIHTDNSRVVSLDNSEKIERIIKKHEDKRLNQNHQKGDFSIH